MIDRRSFLVAVPTVVWAAIAGALPSANWWDARCRVTGLELLQNPDVLSDVVNSPDRWLMALNEDCYYNLLHPDNAHMRGGDA